jgi:hypothetical protein
MRKLVLIFALSLSLMTPMLAACLCPRSEVVQPRLDGRVLDDKGLPRPDAHAEFCLQATDVCTRLDLTNAATFHTEGHSETHWGCLCLPTGRDESDYVLRVTAPDMLPVELPTDSANSVVLHPRPVTQDQARVSLVILYRSVNHFAVVLTSNWIQEAAAQEFSLRVTTPPGTLATALDEVERSSVVQSANVVECRAGVDAFLAAERDPFLIRYGSQWYLVRDPPANSPLRRLLQRLQPGTIESRDDAPAAKALALGQHERVAEEVCGAAVGAPGGVTWLLPSNRAGVGQRSGSERER